MWSKFKKNYNQCIKEILEIKHYVRYDEVDEAITFTDHYSLTLLLQTDSRISIAYIHNENEFYSDRELVLSTIDKQLIIDTINKERENCND